MGQDLALPIQQVFRRLGRAERRSRALLISGGVAALCGGFLLAHGIIARFVALGLPPSILLVAIVLPPLAGVLSLLVPVRRNRILAALQSTSADQSLFLAALSERTTRLLPIVTATATERAAQWLQQPLEHRPLPRWTRGGFVALAIGAVLSFAPGLLHSRSDELAGLLTLAEALLRETEVSALDQALTSDQRAALKSESNRLRQAASQEDAAAITATIRRIEDLLGRMMQGANPAPGSADDGNKHPNSSAAPGLSETKDTLTKLKHLVEALRAGDAALADAQVRLREIKEALPMKDGADLNDLERAAEGLGSGDGRLAAKSLGKLIERYEERQAVLKRALDVIVVSRGVGPSSASEQPFSGNLRGATPTGLQEGTSKPPEDTSPWIPANIDLTASERLILSRYFDGWAAPPSPRSR